VAWPGQHTYKDNNYDPLRKDEHHPLGQWSLSTTKENPAILYDDGAIFCSPTLAFDEEGSAIHCHDSPLGFGHFDNLDTHYFPELPERLKGGRVSLVMGGSNLDAKEEQQAADAVNPIDWAVKGIEERLRATMPEADFYPLISKQYDNQHSTHPIVPEQTTVRGFIFIPRYIATDDQNHVLVIRDNVREIRNTFYWTRLYGTVRE
jgi:hypothetical protein